MIKKNNAGIQQITIKKLIMQGFRKFKDRTEICFNEPKTVIPAANREGKTTISEAILWAFLGTNLEGNDKADKVLMNRNSKEMMVQVEFIDEQGSNQVLKRVRSEENTIITINGNLLKQKELLYGVGGSKNFLLMSLNLDYFFKLSDKEKRDFFISLLPPVDPENALGCFSEFEARFIVDDSAEINKEPNKYLKGLRAELADKELEINRLTGKLEGINPSKEDIPDKKVFDDAQLKALEERYDKLISARIDTNDIEIKIEKLKEQKNKLEQKIAVIENSTIQGQTKDTTELLHKKLVVQNEINLLKSRQYEKAKEKDIIDLTTRVKLLREQYKKERSLPIKEGMTCPVCRHLINKKDIEDAKTIIKGNLIDIQNQAKTINQIIDGLNKEEKENEDKFNNQTKQMISDKTKELARINSEISEIENFNLSLIKDFGENKSLQIAGLTKKASDISKEIETLEKIKKDAGIAFERETESEKQHLKTLLETERMLKQKIDTANAERDFKIKNYNKEIKKYKETITQIKKLKDKTTELKLKISVVKAYNQKNAELLAELIESHFNKLTVSLQKIIHSTGEVKDCFELIYEGENLYSLSNARSQKMRIALEIYDFIVKSTGLKYPLFIDNAESIDDYTTVAHQIIETRVAPGESLFKDISIAEQKTA